MVENVAVVPHAPAATFEADHRRTLDLATEGLVLLGIEEQTAALRDPDGTWRTVGAGATTVWAGGAAVGMDALP